MKLLCVLALALTASVSFAQTPPPPLEGTVVSLVLDHLQLKTAEGIKVVVLPPDVGVVKSTDVAWTDIHQGDWVGVDSKTSPDGTQESVNINVFSPKIIERLKHAPKMQFPMASGDLMTNAPVEQVTLGTDGGALSLKADGAMVAIRVKAATPVHRLTDGTIADIKPSVGLQVRGRPNPDGSVQAAFVTVR